MKKFDYSPNYDELDLRKQPELYTVLDLSYIS
jgi:hypothetical protein